MLRCLHAFLSIPLVRKFHSHDFLVKQSSTFCIWSFGLEPISIHRKQKKNIFVLSPMIVVRCVLYNCVGNLAWLIILFFLAAPEMLGLCGIRRLGVQGDLDLFHSVTNRWFQNLNFLCNRALYDVFDLKFFLNFCRMHKAL